MKIGVATMNEKRTDLQLDSFISKKEYSVQIIKKSIRSKLRYLVMSGLLFITPAFSATTGLPWEGPMAKILASITGPVAQFLGVTAIVISGFGIAFGEAGSGMRRLFQVVLGLSIAFTSAALLNNVFGVSSGVAF